MVQLLKSESGPGKKPSSTVICLVPGAKLGPESTLMNGETRLLTVPLFLPIRRPRRQNKGSTVAVSGYDFHVNPTDS